jgi:signal transduction histidine kinase
MSKTDRLRNLPGQLRWQLALSYMAVTVIALLVVEGMVSVGLGFKVAIISRSTPGELIGYLEKEYVPEARRFLSRIPPDIAGLQKNLAGVDAGALEGEEIRLGDLLLEVTSSRMLSLFFINSDMRLIDSLPHDVLRNTRQGEILDVEEIPGLEGPLAAAMRGLRQVDVLTAQVSPTILVGATPIFDEKDEYRIVGVLAFERRTGFWDVLGAASLLQQFGIALLCITLFAAVIGSLSGGFIARVLIKRFRRISQAARAWSQGDFSAHVGDEAKDELGLLAHSLDEMASQLRILLAEREARSILEERNRLAMDLHDSVKQQAFAASAQLGAAQAQIMVDQNAAAAHLSDAASLLLEARRKLTTLIDELGLAPLQGKDLATAMREYADECARRSGIRMEVSLENHPPCSLELEEGLFRILQGALSNVVRHSGASVTRIGLQHVGGSVALTISDNGRGFDGLQENEGIGLRLMRERAQMLGGNLNVYSNPGMGTIVAVTCPYGQA